MIEDLQNLSEGQDVTLTVDGEEWSGMVISWFHGPAERDSTGVPVRGSLDVEVELTNSTVEAFAPSHHVSINATERRPGDWKDVSGSAWDPVVDKDGTIIKDEWERIDITDISADE